MAFVCKISSNVSRCLSRIIKIFHFTSLTLNIDILNYKISLFRSLTIIINKKWVGGFSWCAREGVEKKWNWWWNFYDFPPQVCASFICWGNFSNIFIFPSKLTQFPRSRKLKFFEINFPQIKLDYLRPLRLRDFFIKDFKLNNLLKNFDFLFNETKKSQ